MTGISKVGSCLARSTAKRRWPAMGLLDRRVSLGRAAAATGIRGAGIGLSATTAGAEPRSRRLRGA
jgi:hypothetical protein